MRFKLLTDTRNFSLLVDGSSLRVKKCHEIMTSCNFKCHEFVVKMIRITDECDIHRLQQALVHKRDQMIQASSAVALAVLPQMAYRQVANDVPCEFMLPKLRD